MPAIMTIIACPGCTVEHSEFRATNNGVRLTTRCISPACRKQFTVAVKRNPVRADELRVLVGFLPKDEKANGDKVNLDKLTLAEVRAYVAEKEELLCGYIAAAAADKDRLLGYQRVRVNKALSDASAAQEERRREQAQADASRVRSEAEARRLARKEAPPTDRVAGKVKGGLDLGMYRQNLLIFLDMKVKAGMLTKEQDTYYRANLHTQAGLWALADALGMPRLG